MNPIRFMAAIAVLVVAIITLPYALVPVVNSADLILVLAPIVFVWLAWPRERRDPRRRRPASRALHDEYARIDQQLDADYPRR